MPIEPHAARFQIGRPTMPPKTDKPFRKPALTPEQDAIAIKERGRRTWGSQPGGITHSSLESRALDEAALPLVLDLLKRKGPLRSPAIMLALDLQEKRLMKRVLPRLRDAGKVKFSKSTCLWSACDD
jgi:hypothetical protein